MPWPARKTTSLLFAILLFSGVTIAQTTTYIETSGKGPSLGSIACDAGWNIEFVCVELNCRHSHDKVFYSHREWPDRDWLYDRLRGPRPYILARRDLFGSHR